MKEKETMSRIESFKTQILNHRHERTNENQAPRTNPVT